MRKSAWKWLLIGSAVTIILLYMMELTSSGIERVYGPFMQQSDESGELYTEVYSEESNMTSSNDPYTTELEKKLMNLEKELEDLKQITLGEVERDEYRYILPQAKREPSVNRLADSTAAVLQSASSNGIEKVATWFQNLIN